MKQSPPISLWGKCKPTIDIHPPLKEYRLDIRSYMWFKSYETPNIVPYLISSNNPCPAVIIAPGGAYMARVNHEKLPVARWLNSIGFTAFVLNYRQGPFRHPIPFLDAQRAIRILRANAASFNIDPNRIGMIGFSAGGHLTASLGTLNTRNWFPPEYSTDEIDQGNDIPDFLILCYPVISMKLIPDGWSYFNLLGKHPAPALVELLSLENQITNKTPPTFIWTTHDDNVISDEHSTLFIEGLKKYNIPHESYIFPHGKHGLALAKKVPEVSQWPSLCELWLKKQKILQKL